MTLRDKLKALTAPCREADAEIAAMFRGPNWTVWRHGRGTITDGTHVICANAYTASLDATVELVEREMPGKNWSVVRYENRTTIATLGDGDRVIADGKHTLPAVALLLALLDAKGIE